jgi:hypothetical protein
MVVRLFVDDNRFVKVTTMDDAMAYVENSVSCVDISIARQMVKEVRESSCMVADALHVSPFRGS